MAQNATEGSRSETSIREAAALHDLVEELTRTVAGLAKELRTADGEIGFEEWTLGTELALVLPAHYVTRAIGVEPSAASKRWRQVRAQIEVYRVLAGQTSPDQTLDIDIPQPWLLHCRKRIMSLVQRIQLAQIMLSVDPMAAARGFEKEIVLRRLGLPPQPAPEEVGTLLERPPPNSWMSRAIELSAAIESHRKGLAIDWPPGEYWEI